MLSNPPRREPSEALAQHAQSSFAKASEDILLSLYASEGWWKGLDSNQRTLARADLQSAAINHSATLPALLP